MKTQEFIEQGSGVITLCGSTRFFFEAMEANRRLTFQNWIVLMCGSWGHSFHKFVENTNTDYEAVKRYKIAMSDAIVVVYDKTHYIGQSTEKETHFARHIGIPVFFFDGERFFGSTETNAPTRDNFKVGWVSDFEEQYGLGY